MPWVFNPATPHPEPIDQVQLRAVYGSEARSGEIVTFSGSAFSWAPASQFVAAQPFLPSVWMVEIVEDDQLNPDRFAEMNLSPHNAEFGEGGPSDSKGGYLRRQYVSHFFGGLEDPSTGTDPRTPHNVPFEQLVWTGDLVGGGVITAEARGWNAGKTANQEEATVNGLIGWELQNAGSGLGLGTDVPSLIYSIDSGTRVVYFPQPYVRDPFDDLLNAGNRDSSGSPFSQGIENSPQIQRTDREDRTFTNLVSPDNRYTYGLLTEGPQLFSLWATEIRVDGNWADDTNHFSGTPERLRLTPIFAPDPLRFVDTRPELIGQL